MSLLGGEISALFGTVFGSIYLGGTLTRVTVTPDGTGGATTSEASQPCRLQVDAVTEAMRLASGYTEKDVRIIVLQSGVDGGDIDSDCTITVLEGPRTGEKFMVTNPINTDPASSYWECRGTPA